MQSSGRVIHTQEEALPGEALTADLKLPQGFVGNPIQKASDEHTLVKGSVVSTSTKTQTKTNSAPRAQNAVQTRVLCFVEKANEISQKSNEQEVWVWVDTTLLLPGLTVATLVSLTHTRLSLLGRHTMRMRRRSKEQDLKPAAPSLEDSLDGMSPSRADAITSLWLMMKRGGLMSAAFLTWRRRFVKIEGQNLVMFSDDGPGADFKGTVPIRGMSVSLARPKNAPPRRPKCVHSQAPVI